MRDHPAGDSVPYLQLDGRDGTFKYGEGQDNQIIDLEGKVIAMDMANIKQGWLAVGAGGADWQGLADGDDWGNPPSQDHKDACAVMVWGEVFGDKAKGFRFRGNSKAHNNLVRAIYNEVKDNLGNGKMPLIKFGKATKINVGAGSSVKVDFQVAPKDKWPDAPNPGGTSEKAAEDAAATDEWAS